MQSLSGNVIFITGAAGGIGAELARRLHRQGTRLVLTDADPKGLAALAAELDNRNVLTATADVRDFAAMKAVADHAAERFGGVDAVVANAGIMSFGSVLNIDPAVFKRVIDIDLLGVFHTVKAVLPSLIERKGYALIVSSAAAYSGSPGLTPYNAAKAGVENFANGFRTEVADLGVAVGTAHMSWVDTPMTRETKSEITTFHKMYGSQLGPMSRMATPQQCAEAFATAIQRRSRHVYCPRWVGILPWIRPLISTRVAERPMRTLAREMLPQLDAEAAAHGRGLTARVESLGSDDIEP